MGSLEVKCLASFRTTNSQKHLGQILTFSKIVCDRQFVHSRKKTKKTTQSRFQHSCQDRLSQIRLFIDRLLMSFSLSAEVQAKSLKLTPTCSLWNDKRDRNRDLSSLLLPLLLRFYIVIPHPQSPTKTALFCCPYQTRSEVYGTDLPETCANVWTVCLLFISSVILTCVHSSLHKTFTCMKRGRVS